MRVIETPASLAAGNRGVSVAIGVFDGVHLGHQAVIQQAVGSARRSQGLAAVITFDRHPNAVIAPDRAPQLLYTLSQKLRALEQCGVHATWVIPFDLPFSAQPAESFVRGLVAGFHHVRSISVGEDFTFGNRRTGDLALLKRMGEELGYVVQGIPPVQLAGQVISSTRIRECIKQGDLETASQLLGRRYSLAGPVLQGRQLGGKLGFPTANLDVTDRVLPPTGVYAGRARVRETWHSAVINLGRRPTLDRSNSTLSFEAHLLDFREDLYGQELEVTLNRYLRPEQAFPNLEALQAQVGQDIGVARQVLAG